MPCVTCGVSWDVPCKLVGAFGPDWLRQGTQLSHLALLCWREHRFSQICCILGPEGWHRVAACGSLLHPSRSPIEEDKMIRSKHPGTQTWFPAAWVPGGSDSSISAAWLPGLAGLMSSSGPCFERWAMEGAGCCRQGGVV